VIEGLNKNMKTATINESDTKLIDFKHKRGMRCWNTYWSPWAKEWYIKPGQYVTDNRGVSKALSAGTNRSNHCNIGFARCAT